MKLTQDKLDQTTENPDTQNKNSAARQQAVAGRFISEEGREGHSFVQSGSGPESRPESHPEDVQV